MKNTEILKFNLINISKNINKKSEAITYLNGLIMGALITDGITIEEFEELKKFLKEECD